MNINQEEKMLPAASLNMWRMFSTVSRISGKAIYQGVLDTGRVTAGTGLVTLGFYGYNKVNPDHNVPFNHLDSKQIENSNERDEVKIIISP